MEVEEEEEKEENKAPIPGQVLRLYPARDAAGQAGAGRGARRGDRAPLGWLCSSERRVIYINISRATRGGGGLWESCKEAEKKKEKNRTTR